MAVNGCFANHHFHPAVFFFSAPLTTIHVLVLTTGLGVWVSERTGQRQRTGIVSRRSVCHFTKQRRGRLGARDHGGDALSKTGDGVSHQKGSYQVSVAIRRFVHVQRERNADVALVSDINLYVEQFNFYPVHLFPQVLAECVLCPTKRKSWFL